MTRDFTYVTDIVDGTIKAAEMGKGIYNIGSGSNITVNTMVLTMRELLGEKIIVKSVTPPTGDVHDTYSDISKAKKELGYFPKVNLYDGIKSCIEWYKESLLV